MKMWPLSTSLRKNLKEQSYLEFVCFGIAFVLILSSNLYADAIPAAAPPATSAAGQPDSSNNITLDFKEADINTVLRVMSLKSKVNIVAGPEVQGTVTIRLENVPWEKALEVVLRTYGYVYERDGNIIRVTTRENLAAEPVVTQTYILNYTKATEIQAAVQDMLTERGRIKVAERTNTIVITDIPTNLYRIGEIINKLDKMTPQAYIDSKVIRTETGLAENLGIEWKTGGTGNNLGSITGSNRPTSFPFTTGVTPTNEGRTNPGFLEQFFPIAGSSGANPRDPKDFPLATNAAPTGSYSFGTLNFSGFNAVLQMLKTKTNTKIVSNPRVVVLNNQAAKIQVGTDVPLPTFERNETTGSVEVTGFSFRSIGVVLNVTPHINSEEEILVDLTPEVSSQGATVSFGDFSVPSFNVTKAVTQVLIHSGETIAIGGLMADNSTITTSQVPYLSDIPIVGKLFRARRQDIPTGDTNKKVETLFFVTVTMVDTEGQPTGKRADAAVQNASQGAPAQAQAVVTVQAAAPANTQAAQSTEKVESSTLTAGAEAPAQESENQTAAAESTTAAPPKPAAA